MRVVSFSTRPAVGRSCSLCRGRQFGAPPIFYRLLVAGLGEIEDRSRGRMSGEGRLVARRKAAPPAPAEGAKGQSVVITCQIASRACGRGRPERPSRRAGGRVSACCSGSTLPGRGVVVCKAWLRTQRQYFGPCLVSGRGDHVHRTGSPGRTRACSRTASRLNGSE
jgi:hypothetical protein